MLLNKKQAIQAFKGFSGAPAKMVKNNTPCPKCGEFMYDKEPGIVLLSDPPKKRVLCKECKYSGFIETDYPQSDIMIDVEKSIEEYKKKNEKSH
ncbi:MAG: hypothetical protein ACFFG0_19170 [Candidatus Thorarchaeota archaeon]